MCERRYGHPAMPTTLTHIALHVRDIAACIDFYTDFCGLKQVHERRDPDGDGRVVWLAEPGREEEFIYVLNVQMALCTAKIEGQTVQKALCTSKKAGLTVQRVICTCTGAALAVQRVLNTSSQLAWTCKESFARSSFREIQSIDILVPKIWYHAPPP